MEKRKRLRAYLIVLVFALAIPVFSDQAQDDLALLEVIGTRDKVDHAIRKALSYLVKQQNSRTGEFKTGNVPNAMTGLACLALMSNGHFPERERYGTHLRKAILYLVAKCDAGKGYFGNEGNGRMYSHGICTLALSAAYGMMPTAEENQQVKEALEQAIKIIIRAQVSAKGPHRGGWRYNLTNTAADLSVTAWQILALRSVRNCNLEVPQEVFDEAVRYLKRTYNDRHKAFTYQGTKPHQCMRAAGVVCMLALGESTKPQDLQLIKNSASFLLSVNPSHGPYYYYRCFYLATAATMLGGKYQERLIPQLENALLKLQKKDGSFKKHSGQYSGIYSTSFAIIALSSRYHFLPILQE